MAEKLPKKLSMVEQARISMGVGNNQTIADLVLERCEGSTSKAFLVISFIATYGVFVEQHGREPRSVSEVAHATLGRRSRATVNRWGAAFKEAFPELHLPTLMWATAREQLTWLDEKDEVLDDGKITLQLGAVTL